MPVLLLLHHAEWYGWAVRWCLSSQHYRPPNPGSQTGSVAPAASQLLAALLLLHSA